jgi:uncharacterized protein
MTILNQTILPGESKTINMEIAKLHSMTPVEVPVIVERSKKSGPVVLFCAGLHGDEINGTEIVRQIIVQKLNKPTCGTIICIPIINIFGFLNQKREFPDGRDLNRVFPGSKTGSLASRFAYYILQEIIPHVDFAIDFHAGGAQRFNAPQTRIVANNLSLKKLAKIFAAPFTLYSNQINGSFRNSCEQSNVEMLLFEGGKSLDINFEVTQEAIEGTKRVLQHLGMLPKTHKTNMGHHTIFIEKSDWIRANFSGLFHGIAKVRDFVEKDALLGVITDPYGKEEYQILAPHNGYLINVNHSPIVYQGDAIYHISTQLENA